MSAGGERAHRARRGWPVRRHAEPGRRRSPLFAALEAPNFRLYLAGQSVSLPGTWMQSVAQSWLVLQLTGSGAALGLVAAAQFLPVLLLGPYGGLIADRADKRRLLLTTQTALATLALALGVLAVTHQVRLWMVFVLAAALGTVNSVDQPCRQTFVPEMVGREQLQNAVSLNSVLTNAARAVGPAIAGVLIAAVGVGPCFLINAASFIAVIAALARIRPSALHRAPPAGREPGQLRQGLRYVSGTAGLLVPLLMMALVGTLAYEFQVSLPLLAKVSLHGDAGTYGFLTAAMGVGAVAGGLVVAGLARTGLLPFTVAAAGFGLAILAAALIPALGGDLAALAGVGFFSTAFMATGNTTLQLTADPRFRGRVMALWSVTFTGSTPVGGPIVGIVADDLGPRYALGLGAVACACATMLGAIAVMRLPAADRHARRPREVDWHAYQQEHAGNR
ncbi:MAG TPA: MFS transporter [Streptosporangiaceae bacterium]|nr:MFS transporter [Streptosporangiaceae bacterium]